MRSRLLAEILERVEAWPAEAQDNLAAIASQMDADLAGQFYEPSSEELLGIDEGLRAAADGRFAAQDRVKAAFVRLRSR